MIWLSRQNLLAAGIAVLATGVGLATGAFFIDTSDPTASDEYHTLTQRVSNGLDRERALRAQVSEREAERGEVESMRASLDERAAALDDRETGLNDREQAVDIAEEEKAARTISGNGTYIVGEDIEPGLYKSDGNSDCYYEISRDGSGGFGGIIKNDIFSGPGAITVSQGQWLKLQRCSEWERQ